MRPKHRSQAGRLCHRTGFTIVELLVAGIIIAFVLGSISMSLANLGRAKDTARQRYVAHLRADTALNQVRRDVISIIRQQDLFYTRLLVYSGWSRENDMPRDEMLVFNNRVRTIRDLAFTGEGQEYETQYRIEESEIGPILWQRRDAFPDEYPEGGGIATPLVEGVVGFHVESYDGLQWFDEWDSDEDGVPLAVRITIITTGARDHEDPMNGPFATLRTVIALDRIAPPLGLELLADEDEDEEGEEQQPTPEELEGLGGGQVIIGPDGQIITPGGGGGPGGRPGGGPRPGGGGGPRPGGGGGGPGGGGGGAGGGDKPGDSSGLDGRPPE